MRLLAAECPRLARHLAAEGVEPELFATHWFNTAFAYTLPFQHLLRLWDIMMLEGNKVVSAAPGFRVRSRTVCCAGLCCTAVLPAVHPRCSYPCLTRVLPSTYAAVASAQLQ